MPASRAFLVLLAVSSGALGGCASAPDPAPALPPAPSFPTLEPEPVRPDPASLARLDPGPAPDLPAGRRQQVDEVVREQSHVSGAPKDFALPAGEPLVVGVPNQGADRSTVDEARVLLAAAFLQHGHPPLDAGRFEEPTLKVNVWPDGDQATTTSRTVQSGTAGAGEAVTTTTTTSEKPWWYDGWLAWQQERGLRIELRDPTSLWVHQLGKYEGLRSRHFLRLFRLAFRREVLQVPLHNVVDDRQLAEYRQALAAHNTKIAAYNQALAQLRQDVRSYEREHDARRRRNQERLDACERQHQAAIADYVGRFRSWQQRDLKARLNLSPERAPALQLPEALGAMAVLEVPADRPATDEAALQAMLADVERQDVPVLMLDLLGEVVSAEGGAVVWAGTFQGLVRDLPDARLRLLERFVAEALK